MSSISVSLNALFKRLQSHAMKRYRLWNHFSAFVVPLDDLDDVEAIMIAATPRTANRSGGKRIPRIDLPSEIKACWTKAVKSAGPKLLGAQLAWAGLCGGKVQVPLGTGETMQRNGGSGKLRARRTEWQSP